MEFPMDLLCFSTTRVVNMELNTSVKFFSESYKHEREILQFPASIHVWFFHAFISVRRTCRLRSETEHKEWWVCHPTAVPSPHQACAMICYIAPGCGFQAWFYYLGNSMSNPVSSLKILFLFKLEESSICTLKQQLNENWWSSNNLEKPT